MRKRVPSDWRAVDCKIGEPAAFEKKAANGDDSLISPWEFVAGQRRGPNLKNLPKRVPQTASSAVGHIDLFWRQRGMNIYASRARFFTCCFFAISALLMVVNIILVLG